MHVRVQMIGAALLLVTGCAHTQTRLQKPDKEPPVKTIGDLTSFANADPVPVSGVGLVVGLDGTGGDPPAGGYRDLLENELRHQGISNIKQLLASRDTSLVLVSGLIPAGAHKDDPFDVEVVLPPGSKTTSLRGGYLQECTLYNYDSTKHLDPNFQGGNHTLLGHPLGRAKGALVVGVGDGDDGPNLRRGRIWGGAHSKIERPFYLVMNADQQRGAVVQQIAERINETFHGPYRGSLSDLCTAKTTSYLVLRVPDQYKLNLPRYLRVIRLIPYEATPPEGSAYRRRLEEQLLDPAHTVTAALRLEALGSDGTATLKTGLASRHALVRFTSAEGLAYLDCPAGGEELATLVQSQPLLRAYCLTALASMDEAVCHVKLRELMADADTEVRYGAFRALRALDEREPAVQGEQLNDSFWLHHVSPNSAPLVHVSTSRRAEVVLFGDEPALVPPFSFLAGEFTVSAGAGDQVCTASRISAHDGTARRQCPLSIEAVLRCMADIGGAYPEAIELLRQVATYQSANCPIAFDALPRALSVYELARQGGTNPDNLHVDKEIAKAQGDLPATPTLYDRGKTASAKRAKQAPGTE